MFKRHALTSAICSIFLFSFNPYIAHAERITICSEQSFSGYHSQRFLCSFNTARGEEIFTTATHSYVSSSWSAQIFHYGSILNGGFWSQSYLVLSSYSAATASRFITNERIGSSEVRINHSGSGVLKVRVESNRTNLKVDGPDINQSNGNLALPHHVTTVTPFSPGPVWVSVKMLSHGNNGTASNSGPTLIEERGLANCVNKGRCYDIINIPLSQRKPIPRGHTNIYATINDQRVWAETTWNDNRFDWPKLDDFFIEKVPDIMGRYSSRWAVAKSNLNSWLDLGIAIKRSSVGNGIDWNLLFTMPVDTSWFLDLKNASDSRIIDKYNLLKNPTYFNTPETRNVVAANVRKKFKDNPSATEVALSKAYSSSNFKVKDYHPQQISFIEAQSGGLITAPSLDPVTAAFGGFHFYLVPFGTAKKKGGKYRVTITSVRIHVIDSFDFNGLQALGCWKEPNIVSIVGQGTCLWNSSFRWYRMMKARGYDHNLFTTPRSETLSTPVSYLVNQ